jgi:hypothetical protein
MPIGLAAEVRRQKADLQNKPFGDTSAEYSV